MKNKELSKDEVAKILFESKVIGHGFSGTIVELDDQTLFKYYNKSLSSTLRTRDMSMLDFDIASIKKMEEQSNSYRMGLAPRKDNMIRKITALENTMSSGVIKGIGTHQDQMIGIYMQNFKEYDSLEDIYKNLSKDEQSYVLASVKILLMDLAKHGILPLDVKEDNILIRKEDLDVQIIDLDGDETRVKSMEYMDQHPDISDIVLKQYRMMVNRLKGRTIDFDLGDL